VADGQPRDLADDLVTAGEGDADAQAATGGVADGVLGGTRLVERMP
jgi:hypothetical protein